MAAADEERQSGFSDTSEVRQLSYRAKEAMSEYQSLRKRMANTNNDPDGDSQLIEALEELEQIVEEFYYALRPYMRGEKRDEWWCTRIIGKDETETPIVLGGPDSQKITLSDDEYQIEELEIAARQVKFIEDYFGAVHKETVEEHVRFEGKRQVEKVRPLLMSFDCYKRAILLLDEIRLDIGFSDEAEEQSEKVAIGKYSDIIQNGE